MNSKSLSLAVSNLVCSIPTICDQMIELASKEQIHPLYLQFARKFFSYIPVDYIQSEKLELFNEIAKEAFDFFKNREAENRKVIILNSLIKKDPAITILLINDNKPFIVDSLGCLLNRLNLQPRFIFHPVIACSRNAEGEIESIYNNKPDSNFESLVVMKILGSFDEEANKELKNEINKVLDQVDRANNCWHSLLDSIKEYALYFERHAKIYKKNNISTQESIEFLNWLTNHNFTFLGKIDFHSGNNELKQEGAITIWQDNLEEIHNIIDSSTNETHQQENIILGRINTISLVHRNNLVDYILIKRLNADGKYDSGSLILGLYSSMLSYQSIQNIPILRKKLEFVMDRAGFSSNGYNYKNLKMIIEAFPREAVIQIRAEDLYCMALHMLSSMMSKNLKLFIQDDHSGAFTNVLIFLPRERLTAGVHNNIIQYLSEIYSGIILTNYITEVAQNFSYLFVTIAVREQASLEASEIEKNINQISSLWHESLYQKLADEIGEYQARLEVKLLDPILPADYKNRYDPDSAVVDIAYLKHATLQAKPLFNLFIIDESNFSLKIYSPSNTIALFNILPSIENLGFKAIDERSFHIKATHNINESWIYEFILSSLSPIAVNLEGNRDALKANVEEAIEQMRTGALAIDSLSKLIVLAGLNWREVKLLKALTRYLHQTAFTYGKGYVQLTLIKHYEYTKLLVQFFEAKFNPAIQGRAKLVEDILGRAKGYLNNVAISSEDKVLRHMLNLIEAMVRTNCYQQVQGQAKDHISFKFNSRAILDLPLPYPHAEIFVYSNDFEAVHLRGGKVARGGIRWSDRGEDYRTEVLGLMKAQMTKNTVIVPVGSKGGFFLLFNQDNYSAEEYKSKVIECYKNFLRGMLDITDNIVAEKIIKPQDTVIYDDDDPYLVVAADKGTATFSDFANSISAEYNFWLNDAFASGGSAGYDHKKMGITAKGAWISVGRHFEKMGIDVETHPITVVGIGDMSGDVFGNGMLCSKAIKLVAAFNHMHIFIDPNSDPVISFKERERLFNLPYSKWSDYNPQLISKGGGVFARSAKSIALTQEIKTLLDINSDEVTPENLIKSILKAKVDLIWNGGIGTYIKASNESNLEIGDKANDALRCNGKEIRAKVIAEGGNLGVSQQGRIEYSQSGGLINTDFIDNSAGVDCSDHEVNIKIALNDAVQSQKLTIEMRNQLLSKMESEIEALVLADNYKQTQAITISQTSASVTTESFSELINSLEEEKLLDRAVEFLPSSSELKRRLNIRQAITRPELSVLLSYSKMSCYSKLHNALLFKDSYFESYLLSYFPLQMRRQYKEEILHHPLKDEIIKTVITNKIINQLGGAIINIIKKETSSSLVEIISTYVAVCEIFNLDDLWNQVECIGPTVDYHIKIDMFTELTKVMRRGISWFIKNRHNPLEMRHLIEEFSIPAKHLSKIIDTLLSGEAKTKFDERIEKYLNAGINKELALSISVLDNLISAFDIISIAKTTNTDQSQVAAIYFLVGSKFHIDWLRKLCDKLIDDSYWNRLSIQSLKDDLYDKQRNLITKITSDNKNDAIDLNEWIKEHKTTINLFTEFVTHIKLHEQLNLNMIILANKKFEMLLRKLV